MADALGDVSLDTGYAEALIIFGDRTIKGVGGGVCQVSTTLFRTAFFGGYQIDERWFHAYRVKYYEQTASGGHDENLAGLDATVFAPQVDFRFTNDTPYWLLMETYPGQALRSPGSSIPPPTGARWTGKPAVCRTSSSHQTRCMKRTPTWQRMRSSRWIGQWLALM